MSPQPPTAQTSQGTAAVLPACTDRSAVLGKLARLGETPAAPATRSECDETAVRLRAEYRKQARNYPLAALAWIRRVK